MAIITAVASVIGTAMTAMAAAAMAAARKGADSPS